MKAARNHSISPVVYVNAFGRNEAALKNSTRLFERINKVHRSVHRNKQQSHLRGVIELVQKIKRSRLASSLDPTLLDSLIDYFSSRGKTRELKHARF